MEKIDSERDTVTFYDMKRKSAGKFDMLHDADNLLQNMYGIFLDERTFVLSTNGQDTVLKYLMETGQILPIARSEYGKLSSIYFDQGENEYYIAIAEELSSNLTGLVLVGKTIYFTANFGNGLFSYGIDDGKATLLTPLNYPTSLVAMSW
ncbi:hypothetical protein [Mesotoga sp. B105.6.4]|uniref:hypothetical protein n=1 Tax=Mesotoga sp. B105.6.4 TaxID=1582224 RepID=UPI000CCC74AB|nr:hypothetical protein [Mesotoga sp. B105.6.4]PNS36197.1 hypothetical protein RJ60_12610 [Mesotoga sp. B105.6.4]